MDLRLTFNDDPINYDRLRPRYTDDLFQDVIEFSALNNKTRALEIGIGTGQATLPFLRTGSEITAIELGNKLAEYSRKKYCMFENLKVINQEFESTKLDENAHDLVYSASAFHWIPQETGIPKVKKLLKSGGVFAWFSVHPIYALKHVYIHEAMQKVYRRYSDFFEEKSLLLDYETMQQLNETKRLRRINSFEEYGFIDITSKVYYSKRTLKAQDYTKLISTYSDHKAIPEKTRIKFLNEINEVIDLCGGEFTLSDTMILVMGRKS